MVGALSLINTAIAQWADKGVRGPEINITDAFSSSLESNHLPIDQLVVASLVSGLTVERNSCKDGTGLVSDNSVLKIIIQILSQDIDTLPAKRANAQPNAKDAIIIVIKSMT